MSVDRVYDSKCYAHSACSGNGLVVSQRESTYQLYMLVGSVGNRDYEPNLVIVTHRACKAMCFAFAVGAKEYPVRGTSEEILCRLREVRYD